MINIFARACSAVDRYAVRGTGQLMSLFIYGLLSPTLLLVAVLRAIASKPWSYPR